MQGTHGASSADQTGRRHFLSRVIAALQGTIGGALGIVLGGAVVAPGLVRRQANWLSAGALSALPADTPTPVTIRVAREDGYNHVVSREVVFLVKSGSEVMALSSTCTHLGCRVSWVADAKELRCPCHGGKFDAAGVVKDGPPPAPLARLQTKVDGDQVMVQL
jgi:menaquinol-cytochrome c reductase iron-sulfur subunit